MARLAFPPFLRVFKDNGDVCTDATITWKLAGTSTETSSYTTSALSVARTNPVSADSLGIFPAMWLADGLAYDCVITGTGLTTQTILSAYPAFGAGGDAGPCQGRLTLTSGDPVTAGDVTGSDAIYYSPYVGNLIGLYDGSTIAALAFSEATLTLSSMTNDRVYDVYGFLDPSDATTFRLGHIIWSSNTARGAAATLERVLGMWTNDLAVTLNNGATSYSVAANKATYLGTFYYETTNKVVDSKAKRNLWNTYNRRKRFMAVYPTVDTYNYTTATIRQMNADTANQLDFVRGLDEDEVSAIGKQFCSNSTAGVSALGGIGLDSTTAFTGLTGNSPNSVVNARHELNSAYCGLPGIGRHYLSLNEYSSAGGTCTWAGDAGAPTLLQAGIVGEVWA